MSHGLRSKPQSWDLAISCTGRPQDDFCVGLVSRPWMWPKVVCCLLGVILLWCVRMEHPLLCALSLPILGHF